MYIARIGIYLLDSCLHGNDGKGIMILDSRFHGNDGRRKLPLKWRILRMNKMNAGKGRILAQIRGVAAIWGRNTERPIKTKEEEERTN